MPSNNLKMVVDTIEMTDCSVHDKLNQLLVKVIDIEAGLYQVNQNMVHYENRLTFNWFNIDSKN